MLSPGELDVFVSLEHSKRMVQTDVLKPEISETLAEEKLSHFSKVLSLPLLSQYSPESRQKYTELQAEFMVTIDMVLVNAGCELASDDEIILDLSGSVKDGW